MAKCKAGERFASVEALPHQVRREPRVGPWRFAPTRCSASRGRRRGPRRRSTCGVCTASASPASRSFRSSDQRSRGGTASWCRTCRDSARRRPSRTVAATFDRLVTRVQQLVAAFSGERRIAFVGHSIGAMIATEVARSIGARVQTRFDQHRGQSDPADAYLTGRAAAHSTPATTSRSSSTASVRRPKTGNPVPPACSRACTSRTRDHLELGADRRRPVDRGPSRSGLRGGRLPKALLLR